jgi:ankyrin repeat protein
MKDFENISEKDLINEFKEGRGRNSIHFAAGRGDWKVLESLLEMGGNLESKDEEGNSVLMVAI